MAKGLNILDVSRARKINLCRRQLKILHGFRRYPRGKKEVLALNVVLPFSPPFSLMSLGFEVSPPQLVTTSSHLDPENHSVFPFSTVVISAGAIRTLHYKIGFVFNGLAWL